MDPSAADVTTLLNKLAHGDQEVAAQLVPLIYDELRRIAAHRLRHERPGHTLEATALVHEAYLKLAGQPNAKWQNRAQFFGVASQLMRRILIDYAQAALVHELIEARDEKRLLRYQKHLARQELLIVDELGFVPLSKTGAEMLFEIFSQRYERTSTLVTSNLPFAEWTEVLGSERLTGALLDRLTHSSIPESRPSRSRLASRQCNDTTSAYRTSSRSE